MTILKKMSAKLDDSHAGIRDVRIDDTNVHKLPFRIVIAEDQTVINSFNDSILNIYNFRTRARQWDPSLEQQFHILLYALEDWAQKQEL